MSGKARWYEVGKMNRIEEKRIEAMDLTVFLLDKKTST